MHLGPHRVVSRINHTYSNDGVVVKVTMDSSGMLRAGVRTTGKSVVLFHSHILPGLQLTLSWSAFPSH